MNVTMAISYCIHTLGDNCAKVLEYQTLNLEHQILNAE